ncbi:hypothetical protein AAU57_03620 [Nonlabens sp. YIK11]|uniref:DUF2490 domain-containing protein n=1 Tax=Nonlabens sp. YIK11 TaxID=1453349 RepID=UPI0006DC0A3F|nr:DUF2490 domain-containing protein [Nonlabens sp. YIK11]KQC32521.1 hypothetical protein AAU57_03620 [Nonlabens sp. YIK11]
MTSFFFRILMLLMPVLAMSQVADRLVFQPAIKVSWNPASRWSFNTAVEQRTQINDDAQAISMQLTQFGQYEVGFYSQIGIGVMYRELFDDNLPEEVRFMEQYVYTKKYNQLQLAHRLRWDQRLRGDRLTHRWRYRLSGSIPLNGNDLNPSEYYVVSHLETLFIAEDGLRPIYEQRVGLGIGRQIGSNYKLQFNTQYRWLDITAATTTSLFLNVALYASL